jgi:hypothetical protein
MAKPYKHALSSAKRFGGNADDYLDIHNLMDSSKAALADKVFGITRTNSDGRTYSVRDIGEQHVLEDFGMKFIPTAQDYLESIRMEGWMQNGAGIPPSAKGLYESTRTVQAEVSGVGNTQGECGQAITD